MAVEKEMVNEVGVESWEEARKTVPEIVTEMSVGVTESIDNESVRDRHFSFSFITYWVSSMGPCVTCVGVVLGGVGKVRVRGGLG